MKYYVTGFMYSEDREKVVLIKKNQPLWQRGFLNGVGGKIEADETPQMAMAREFEEETGVKTTSNEWKLFSIIHRPTQYKVYFLFSITNKMFEAKTVEEEEVFICDVNNLPEKKIFNLNWLIPMSLDSQLTFNKAIEIEEIKKER